MRVARSACKTEGRPLRGTKAAAGRHRPREWRVAASLQTAARPGPALATVPWTRWASSHWQAGQVRLRPTQCMPAGTTAAVCASQCGAPRITQLHPYGLNSICREASPSTVQQSAWWPAKRRVQHGGLHVLAGRPTAGRGARAAHRWRFRRRGENQRKIARTKFGEGCSGVRRLKQCFTFSRIGARFDYLSGGTANVG